MAPHEKSLKELAKENPTRLGDPVSLKAETSDTEPTEHDRGAAGGSDNADNGGASASSASSSSSTKPSRKHLTPHNVKKLAPTEGDLATESEQADESGEGGKEAKSLKQRAEGKLKEGNATQLGDPVSLKAETSETEPTEHDRGAQGGRKGGKSKL